MIKAIIFDYDGVIVDSEKKRFDDLNIIISKYGLSLKQSDYKTMLGEKSTYFLSNKFPKLTKSEIEDIMACRYKMRYENPNEPLIPDIVKVIDYVASKKLKIAITTGSSRGIVDYVLKKNKLTKYFDLIISGDDFKSSKPSPECYHLTLKKLKLNPSEVIVIEDSVAGVTSAKDAGCTVLGITTTVDKNNIKHADKVFSSHKEILKYLTKLEL